MKKRMTRSEILEAARKCVCEDRDKQYGSPEDNFSRIAALWSLYCNKSFTRKDVAVMMMLLKIARLIGGDSIDNYIDIAGYAACGGEVASAEEVVHESTDTNEKPYNTILSVSANFGKHIVKMERVCAPRGKFWYRDKKTYVGIDNSVGEKIVKEFRSKRECIEWLGGVADQDDIEDI